MEIVYEEVGREKVIQYVINPTYVSADSVAGRYRAILDHLHKEPWLLLHFAVTISDQKTVEAILESSQESVMNKQDEHGNTAVHLVVTTSHLRCLQVLLFFYPDLSIMNFAGETPLFYAAKHRNWDAFQLLINHGTVIDVPSDRLLLLSIQDKQVDIVRVLVEKGGNINALNEKVRTQIKLYNCVLIAMK
jgi:hypothetical protein